MGKKFKIISFGCKANTYESKAYENQLISLGLESSKNNFFELCIVNSCCVTKTAENNVLKTIKNLKSKNLNSKFYITGCLSNEAKEDLEKNFVIFENTKKQELISNIFPDQMVPKFMINSFSSYTRAFVKIQDGCDNFCSYCIIPHTRGRSRSRASKEIIEEVNNLSKKGYQEIVLTGIDIGDYKSDMDLSDLILEIEKNSRIKRIRVSSIEPEDVDEKLLNTIMQSKKFCNSLHLVLQSGSNNVLKKMRRKYSIEEFLEKIDIIKKFDPNFTFTTDVIVGFPNEKNKDFQKTLDVIRKVKFLKVHIFGYSKREKTLASKLKELDPKILKDRKKIALKVALDTQKEKNKEFINKKLKVLFETKKENYQIGHSKNFLKVFVKSNENLKNNILDVTITKTEKNYLIGEI